MTAIAPPRRKPIPDSVKVQVLLRQLGLKGKKVDWSHEPALGLRAIKQDGSDYDPAQLDPEFIYAREAEDHDKLTFKDNGSGRGDLAAIAHVKRTAKKHRAHQEAMAAKAEGRTIERPRKAMIRSRGFDKRHRPLRGGTNLRGRP